MAIKQLQSEGRSPAELEAKLLSEAAVMHNLRHRNIIRMLGASVLMA